MREAVFLLDAEVLEGVFLARNAIANLRPRIAEIEVTNDHLTDPYAELGVGVTNDHLTGGDGFLFG